MKRATQPAWHPPVTYAEVVAQERRAVEARLKRLAQARKLIVALEPDLLRLRDKSVHFNIEGYSGLLVDCREDLCVGRAVNAIRLDTGISDGMGDRAIHALIELGYVFERCYGDAHWPSAILRRPKTQIRLVVRCTQGYIATLGSKEAA